MPRYIDADELLARLKRTPRYFDVKFDIEQMPTADVVPRSEGEWKKVSDKAPRYVCASCNHLYNNKGYKYCPNCGARMKGVKR
jgi:rubrerythrin